MPESAGGVRSIYPQRPGRNDGNIYVGTTRNNILEGSLQRRFNQVVFGHGRQLWGLAVHPDDEVFATAGHDKYIALWRRHKLLWTTQVQINVFTTLSFQELQFIENTFLLIHHLRLALSASVLPFIRLEWLWRLARQRVTFSFSQQILELLWRPSEFAGLPFHALAIIQVSWLLLIIINYTIKNCKLLFPWFTAGETIAMGSQNGSIYLFKVSRDGFSYKKSNKIRGTQPLVQLDWSSDSRFLQTVTQDYDLVFCKFAAIFILFVSKTIRIRNKTQILYSH